MWKAWYRSELGKNVRFTSHSKSVHTKALYKKAYSIGIKKNDFDWLVEHEVITTDLEIINKKAVFEAVLFMILSVLVQDNNKLIAPLILWYFLEHENKLPFEYWIFGFIDRTGITNLSQNNIQRRKNVYFKSVSRDWLEKCIRVFTESKTTAHHYSSSTVSNPKVRLCKGSVLLGDFYNYLFAR
jgi:hypothetical protein